VGTASGKGVGMGISVVEDALSLVSGPLSGEDLIVAVVDSLRCLRTMVRASMRIRHVSASKSQGEPAPSRMDLSP
jgi:hypothetical protein